MGEYRNKVISLAWYPDQGYLAVDIHRLCSSDEDYHGEPSVLIVLVESASGSIKPQLMHSPPELSEGYWAEVCN